MKTNNGILLCEDSNTVALATRFALEGEGLHVDTAKSTAEALQKLEVKIPDLILLDLNLPEEGGAAVIRKLKASPKTQNIPVLLFSASDDLASISEELKADGYIKKPYEVADLIATVQKHLAKVS